MSSLDQAGQTHLNSIQKKTGKSLEEMAVIVKKSGYSKHTELHSGGKRQAENKSLEEVVDGMYSGARAGMRPIHEALMAEISKLGEFEIEPKKGYLSLRRKKQFVMIGPVTSKRLELGLNIKDLPPANRLLKQPRGSMCNYIVKLTDASQVNAEMGAWVKFAYEEAG